MTPQIPHIPRYFTVNLPALPPLHEKDCAHSCKYFARFWPAATVRRQAHWERKEWLQLWKRTDALRDCDANRRPRPLPDAYAYSSRAAGNDNHERGNRTL